MPCQQGPVEQTSRPGGVDTGSDLSLLYEHLLLLHPVQSTRMKNKQSGMSVGCLIESLKAEAQLVTIEHIVDTENPDVALDAFTDVRRETLQE